MRKRLVRILIAVAALGIAAGCSGNSDSGHGGSLDPCRQIGDDSIRAAGFDPATKLVNGDMAGMPAPECTYTSPAHGLLRLDLLASSSSDGGGEYDRLLAEAKSRATANGRTQPEVSKINGRDAFTRPEEITSDDKSIPLGCTITLRTTSGAIKLNVLPHAEDLTHTEDACTTVVHAATALEPAFADRN